MEGKRDPDSQEAITAIRSLRGMSKANMDELTTSSEAIAALRANGAIMAAITPETEAISIKYTSQCSFKEI